MSIPILDALNILQALVSEVILVLRERLPLHDNVSAMSEWSGNGSDFERKYGNSEWSLDSEEDEGEEEKKGAEIKDSGK